MVEIYLSLDRSAVSIVRSLGSRWRKRGLENRYKSPACELRYMDICIPYELWWFGGAIGPSPDLQYTHPNALVDA